MTLSDGEKLIILMLADLYKQLKIKGEFDPDFISTTIHNDRLWGLAWRYSGIPFEKAQSPPEVSETADILDMWGFLEDSYGKLSAVDKERVAKETGREDVRFIGFDGNNEAHYGIMRYLIEQLHRFERFKDHNMDSHSPTIDRYRRMIDVFNPIRPKLSDRLLNADEVIAVLKAQ